MTDFLWRFSVGRNCGFRVILKSRKKQEECCCRCRWVFLREHFRNWQTICLFKCLINIDHPDESIAWIFSKVDLFAQSIYTGEAFRLNFVKKPLLLPPLSQKTLENVYSDNTKLITINIFLRTIGLFAERYVKIFEIYLYYITIRFMQIKSHLFFYLNQIN